MKIGTMMITAGVVALGLASLTPSKAQGPLYDRVNVNLPYTVTIGDRTLPPGDYVIQQLRDQGGGSRVLLIYSDNGMKFETSAMTIPALQGTAVTQDNTRVMLHHFGNDYYFDKVWIQGKDYGYEFPLPDSVKSRQRERMEPISVAANYSSVQSTEATTSAATTKQTTTPAATNSQTTTTAATNKQTTSPAATTPATSAATSGQTTLGRAAEQQATTPSTTTSTMTAQNKSTMQPATTPSTTMATSTAAQHNATSAGSADRTMPNTSAGWLMMLLSGGALSSASFALRRKR